MISVIIPAYNCKNTIVRCVNSVLSQTAFEYIREIIVINDGSTDDTLIELEKNFKNNIFVKIYSKKNGGVSSARNYGIRKSCANWIALLDSDDIWVENKIEKQVNIIKNHDDILFLGTGRNNEMVKIGRKVTDNIYEISTKLMLFKSWPHTSTALIRKDVIMEAGMYDERRFHAEDGQLWLKILKKHKIYYISETLEIAGDYKKTFGEKGLSANLSEMHRGNVLNIKECYHRKQISIFWLIVFLFYEDVKFIRRKVLSRK